MSFIPVKTPKIIKRVLPNILWNITTKRKVIYLTFDDGPTPKITRWILQQLALYNAKATFFCIGKNIALYPDIFKAIIDDKHRIGNHTFTHSNGWKTPLEEYITDIKRTTELIIATTNSNSFPQQNQLFRPPYGKLTPKQYQYLKTHNYKVVYWDVLSFDWDKHTTNEECYSNITKHTQRGSIVVCHDSKKAFENLKIVLPKVLNHFSKKGYSFEAI